MKNVAPSLSKESLALVAYYGVTAGIGFVFWVLASKFYLQSEVGTGASLIALAGLASSLALLGLSYGVVRYLPSDIEKHRASDTLNSSMNLVLIASTASALGFCTVAWWIRSSFDESLAQIASSIAVSGVLVLVSAIPLIQVNSLIAIGRSAVALRIAVVIGAAKLFLLPVLSSLGVVGITIAILASSLLGFFLGYRALMKWIPGYQIRWGIAWDRIREMINFSIANHFASIFAVIPGSVVPAILAGTIGPENSALFYVAWMISNVMAIIPGAVSMALFAAGSRSASRLQQLAREGLLMTTALTVPLVSSVWFFRREILSAIGTGFSSADNLLSVLCLYVLLNMIFTYEVSVHRILKRAWTIVVLCAISSILGVAMALVKPFSLTLEGTGWGLTLGLAIAVVIGLPRTIKSTMESGQRK